MTWRSTLLALWRAWQRQFDMQLLWPACKRQAADLDTARLAFIQHMGMDAAWRDRFTNEEELGEWVREHLV